MCICHTGYDGDGLTCNGKKTPMTTAMPAVALGN